MLQVATFQVPEAVDRGEVFHAILPSALGPVLFASEGGLLTRLQFADTRSLPALAALGREEPDRFAVVSAELDAWLSGRSRCFRTRFRLAGTEFQLSVWTALLGLEWGATASYGELAQRLGRPEAVRAVAAAVGKNPLLVIVPCHRVLGARGELTGYAAGLERKRRLLELEAGVS